MAICGYKRYLCMKTIVHFAQWKIIVHIANEFLHADAYHAPENDLYL